MLVHKRVGVKPYKGSGLSYIGEVFKGVEDGLCWDILSKVKDKFSFHAFHY